jgi:hypothetical protein
MHTILGVLRLGSGFTAEELATDLVTASSQALDSWTTTED